VTSFWYLRKCHKLKSPNFLRYMDYLTECDVSQAFVISPGWLNFALWRLRFVSPQHRLDLCHPSGAWKFEVAPRSWKVCTPLHVLALTFSILCASVNKLIVTTSGLHVMRQSQDAAQYYVTRTFPNMSRTRRKNIVKLLRAQRL
jgi:hypothetical protein